VEIVVERRAEHGIQRVEMRAHMIRELILVAEALNEFAKRGLRPIIIGAVEHCVERAFEMQNRNTGTFARLSTDPFGKGLEAAVVPHIARTRPKFDRSLQRRDPGFER
jgi:hypothetical protein